MGYRGGAAGKRGGRVLGVGSHTRYRMHERPFHHVSCIGLKRGAKFAPYILSTKGGVMKRFFVFTFLAVLFLVATCPVAEVGFAQDKVISLRFSDQFPPSDPQSITLNQWCKEVEKRTNGKVTVRLYPGSTLTPPFQTYQSVVDGVVDIGDSVPAYTVGRFPLFSILWDGPFEYPGGLFLSKLSRDFYDKFRPKEFDDVKILYFHANGEGVLHTKKPVTKIDTLKGMRIRTMGENSIIMAALGAAVVAMPMPEVYDALSKGVAEGVISNYATLRQWKINEVTKYTTELKGTAFKAIFAVVMNKKKWNTIPPEHQKIIEQVGAEWSEKQSKLWDTMDAESKEWAVKQGHQIIQLPPEEHAKWAAKAEPYYGRYTTETKQKNLPGEEAVKFVRDYLKRAQTAK
jgi:TRAP-type transport system periplasmic protein